jgi:GTP-binding protein
VIEKVVDGERLEPYEQLEVEVSKDALGAVVELAGKRRGEVVDMKYRDDGSAHCVYRIPTRGLLGFRQAFLTNTRGQGVMNTLFAGYGPYAGDIDSRSLGSLIAWEDGTTTTFGLAQAQERGQLFIGPGVEVYEGMVVGEHIRDRDLEVNVVRRKHLTNMRSSNSDIAVRLDGMRDLSLDDAIEFLADDELLEVTPRAYRIRKRVLAKQDRDRLIGQRKKAAGVAD